MRLGILGTGYVGLVTGTCFAEMGNQVICADLDQKKIKRLRQGVIPIYEPGLAEIVQRNLLAKRVVFTTDLRKTVEDSEIIFICVGTPDKDYGLVDLTYVENAAKTIGQYLNDHDKIIVNKSTVPVGTAKEVYKIIKEVLQKRNQSYRFAVVSNPEFLKEGNAVEDFLKPDRIVIGSENGLATEKMRALYNPFIKNGRPIFFLDQESAEMSKYAANALLACKISFINQIAHLCDIVGADIENVRRVVSADHRIGSHFLFPGCGYGGSCFPKDVQGLSALGKKHGYSAALIEAIETVNVEQKKLLARKIIKKSGNLEKKKIAVWGLAFKPRTDDMRNAPAITIIEALLAKGAKITAYDPVAMPEAKKILGKRINYAPDMYTPLKDANLLVVTTEWPEFRTPDFAKMKTLLKYPVIYDGRNIYDPQQIRKLGFQYYGIGRR